MGLQTISAPWVLSLSPSLETLCLIQWMIVSIHFCICQALAEPLSRQTYQAPVSRLLLASAIVSGFGGWMTHKPPQVEQSLDGHSFSFCSELCLCNSFHGILFPLLRRIQSFWANIHLSVSAYQVCSFVIVLSSSGRYPSDPFICLSLQKFIIF